MRRSLPLVAFVAAFALPAAAQTAAEVAPPPVPEAKPPALEVIDDSVQPQVTIRMRDGDTVEEHRVNGKLFRIIVTPAHGVPYILVDQSGDGNFVRVDTQGSPQLSVPMWVIGTF